MLKTAKSFICLTYVSLFVFFSLETRVCQLEGRALVNEEAWINFQLHLPLAALKSSQINASFIWYGLKLYITHSENGQKRSRSQKKIPSGDLDEMMLRKHLQSLVCFNAEAWPNSNRNLCLSSLTSIYLTHNDRCFYTRDSCIFKGFIINTFIRFGTFFNRKATLELFRVFFPYCL